MENKLLPPSSFERSHNHQESATVHTNESPHCNNIDEKCSSNLSDNCVSDSIPVPGSTPLEEIILNQNLHLDRLKKEISCLKTEHSRAQIEYDGKLSAEKLKCANQIELFHQKMENLSMKHALELQMIGNKHDEELQVAKNEMSIYIQDQIQQAKCLQNEIENLKDLCQKREDEIVKLKCLLSSKGECDGAEEMHVSSQSHRELQSRLAGVEEQNELLRRRLRAQQAIAKEQHTVITRDFQKGTEVKSAKLLESWQEKVFALLIQLESRSIACESLETTCRSQVTELKGRLSAAATETEILRQTVKDKQLQLDLNCQELTVRGRELTRLENGRKSLLQLLHKCLGNLVNDLQSEPWRNVLEKFSSQNERLHVLGERVSSAARRLNLLKSQLSRKKVLDDLEAKTKAADCSSVCAQLEEEMKRVLRERELLSTQIENDANMIHFRMENVHQQYQAKLENMKKSLRTLEGRLSDSQQELVRLRGDKEKYEKLHEAQLKKTQKLSKDCAVKEKTHAHEVEQLKRNVESLTEALRHLTKSGSGDSKAVKGLRRAEGSTPAAGSPCDGLLRENCESRTARCASDEWREFCGGASDDSGDRCVQHLLRDIKGLTDELAT